MAGVVVARGRFWWAGVVAARNGGPGKVLVATGSVWAGSDVWGSVNLTMMMMVEDQLAASSRLSDSQRMYLASVSI